MELIVLIVMLALAWGFVILPQQRRVKTHRAFVAALEVGDEVITTAGLYGTITGLDDDRVTLRVAPGVELTVARLAIGRPQASAPAPQPSDPAPTDDLPE